MAANKTELISIVQRMEQGGESEDTIKRFVQEWRSRNDSQPAKEQRGATGSFEPEQNAYDQHGVVGALFPQTVSATEKGAGFGGRVLAGMGDVATLPQRGVAAAATLAGFNTEDAGLRNRGEGLAEAGRAMAQYKPADDVQGFQRFAQEAAYDPTLIPGLAAGATEVKLASKLPGVLKAAIPAASGALQAAGSSAIRQVADTGEIDAGETAAAGGLGAAVPLAATGATSLVKKVAGDAGKRLIQALIRPGQRGMREGFDADYILKDKELLAAAGEGIEGLQTALKNKFNGLAEEVRQIQQTAGQDVNVDVPAVFMRTAKKLKASNEFTGMKRELLDAISDLQDNLDNEIESFDEFTDLATAMKLRTNYGTKVKWEPGISGAGRKAAHAAGAEEKVYDAFYKELSDEIKKKAPDAIKEIDKEFTKLIPALKAVNRRVLVETSNLPVGLMETIGGGAFGAASAFGGEGDITERAKRGALGALGGVVAAKAMKSPKTGEMLYRASQSIPSVTGAATGRAVNPAVLMAGEEEEDRKRLGFPMGGRR